VTDVRKVNLARLVDPRRIAVVGASPRERSFGERVLHNLRDFEGRVWAVNPKYERIGDIACFPSMSALDAVPDCAVLVGNRDTVEASVRECAALGVGSAIVFASGFAETGKPDRVEQQARLAALARETGVRVLGPNCMGIVNCASGARMTFQSVIPPAPRTTRAIGLVSQSGALGLGLGQASERGVPFSHVLTCGNACDVDIADFVDFLVDSPGCVAIACSFEGLAQPRKLLEAAMRAWKAGKPLVVHKMAIGELGSAAAASHTGSLAGSHRLYRGMLEQAGAIVVDAFEALIETAAFFAKAPAPRARGVAVLATSGGAAILAADEAEARGVPLPQPAAATSAVLREHVPEFGSIANPCDATAQVLNNPASLDACADALLADPQYSAMVVPHTLAYAFGLARLATFDEVARRQDRIVCNVWTSEWMGGPGMRESETAERVALFRSMRNCFAALGAWHRSADRRAADAPERPSEGSAAQSVDVARQTRVRAMLRAASARTLTERHSKSLLAPYGIPGTREQLAATSEEAARLAADIGFPVALKAESAHLPHKTEAGVVRLDLRTHDAVVAACAEIQANARRHAPDAKIEGFLVQEMAPRGIELVVGGRVDPLFGPVVVVGLGGVFVEAIDDTVSATAPLDRSEALRLLASLRHARILDGFRGIPAVDRDAVARVIVGVSEFLVEQRDDVSELDINPLVCRGDRLLAVDALVVRPR
jgi:acetyl-CoA synthetase